MLGNTWGYGLIAGSGTPKVYVQPTAAYEIDEQGSDGFMAFNVLLGHSTGTAATITYETEEGTADAGVDYDNSYEQGTATGQIVIPIGEHDTTISVHLNHGYDEPDVEDFTLHATHQDYSASATGLIYDSDEDPTEVLEHIKLVAVNFTGSHTITRDPDAQGIATAYTGAEWVDDDGDGVIEPGDGDHSYPVAYNRGATLTGTATFELDSPWSGGVLRFFASCVDDYYVDWTVANINGTTVTVQFTMAGAFPSTVKYYDDFPMTWQAEVQGEYGSAQVGVSSTDLYLTYDTPLNLTDDTPPVVIPIYETVLHLGTVAADGEATEDGVIEAVWDNVFDGNSVQTVGGMTLYYYYQYNTTRQTTLELLTPHLTTAGMIGDGTCTAWAHFMLDVIAAQGIERADDWITIEKNDVDDEGFLINSWTFGAKNSHDAIVHTDGTPLAALLDKYEYVNVVLPGTQFPTSVFDQNGIGYDGFAFADVTYTNGTQGKGPNNKPAALFVAHEVLQFTIGGHTAWLDPSYGCYYSGFTEEYRLANFDQSVVAGYWAIRVEWIKESVVGDINGNSIIENVQTFVVLFRENAGATEVKVKTAE